jgi:hypothetical protein
LQWPRYNGIKRLGPRLWNMDWLSCLLLLNMHEIGVINYLGICSSIIMESNKHKVLPHDLNKLHFKVLGWQFSKTLIQAFEEDDDCIRMVVWMIYKIQIIVNICMVNLLTTLDKLRSNINVHMLQGRKNKCSWDLRKVQCWWRWKKLQRKSH